MIRFPFADATTLSDAPVPQGEAATLRWSEEALVAELPGALLFFGRWGEAFGCWSVTSGTVAKLRMETPLFDRLGHWRRDAAPFNLDIRSGASLWHGYLALIPSHVRRLVAPYGNGQWRVLEQVAEDPQLLRQLDREQSAKWKPLGWKPAAPQLSAMLPSARP